MAEITLWFERADAAEAAMKLAGQYFLNCPGVDTEEAPENAPNDDDPGVFRISAMGGWQYIMLFLSHLYGHPSAWLAATTPPPVMPGNPAERSDRVALAHRVFAVGGAVTVVTVARYDHFNEEWVADGENYPIPHPLVWTALSALPDWVLTMPCDRLDKSLDELETEADKRALNRLLSRGVITKAEHERFSARKSDAVMAEIESITTGTCAQMGIGERADTVTKVRILSGLAAQTVDAAKAAEKATEANKQLALRIIEMEQRTELAERNDTLKSRYLRVTGYNDDVAKGQGVRGEVPPLYPTGCVCQGDTPGICKVIKPSVVTMGQDVIGGEAGAND